jgi:hypothetical protein
VNQIIEDYFDHVETALIASAAVQAFQVLKRDVSSSDGKYRIKVILADTSIIELFEYVVELDGQVMLRKYSFHWQTSTEALINRWDNAPHYMHLPNAPHHRHNADGTVSALLDVPDFLSVLKMIEDSILR